MARTPGLLPLPRSRPALEAELVRLERELRRVSSSAGVRLLAIERRRVVIAIDHLERNTAA